MSKNPFVPESDVKYVIVDGREKVLLTAFSKLKIKVIFTQKCNAVYEAISYHPDIIMHPVGEKTFVLAPNVSRHFINLLKNLNIKVIIGQTYLKRNYPDNIAYNVARIGTFAFHNLKYTDKVLRDYLERENVNFINVKQGYTKCNMAIIDNQSFITSDKGIYDKALLYGLDGLLIEKGDIFLKGFDYGFIGGCVGLIGKNKLVINGDLKKHKEFEKINEFLYKKRIETIFLTIDKLKDIGSIIPLY